MTTLLAAFLLVVVLPFLIPSWRTALAALAVQGLLMGWMIFMRGPVAGPDRIITLIDLVAVRGLLVPFMLYRVMRAQNAPPRGDVIPPNMLSWTLVVALIALAFRFASRLDPGGAATQTTTAAAASGLLLGLFTLATQTGVFTQAVGALCVENAVALFELGQPEGSSPLPIKLGLAAVFLLSACLFVLYVRWLDPVGAPEFAPEGPVL
jgi:hydrogenase-4 membrane subunit HyfE